MRQPNIQKKNWNKSLFLSPLGLPFQIANHINVLAVSNPYFFHFCSFSPDCYKRITEKCARNLPDCCRVGSLGQGWLLRKPQLPGTSYGRAARMQEKKYMNGRDESLVGSDEMTARVVAYLSPYMFWGTLGVICVGVLLLH